MAVCVELGHFSLVLRGIAPQAGGLITIDDADRIADEESAAHHVFLALLEFEDLLGVVTEADRRTPGEVLGLDIRRVQREVETVVGDLADIVLGSGITGDGRQRDGEDQAVGIVLINIEDAGKAAAPEGEVDTGIHLRRRFPTDGIVREGRRRDIGGLSRGAIVDRTGSQQVLGAVRTDRIVTGLTPAETEFQLAEEILILHERLLVDSPTEGDGREAVPFVALAQLGGAVITIGEREEVAVLVAVGDAGHVGSHLVLCQRVVGRAVQDADGFGIQAPVRLGLPQCDTRSAHRIHRRAHRGHRLLQQGDVHAVVAELAVVGEDVVEGPGETLRSIRTDIVGTLGHSVRALGRQVTIALRVGNLRTESRLEGQALQRRPNILEVELGVESTGDVEVLIPDVGLADFVDDRRDNFISTRIDDA